LLAIAGLFYTQATFDGQDPKAALDYRGHVVFGHDDQLR
jgi:hypothetical protein